MVLEQSVASGTQFGRCWCSQPASGRDAFSVTATDSQLPVHPASHLSDEEMGIALRQAFYG
jgi:hypothetical protein